MWFVVVFAVLRCWGQAPIMAEEQGSRSGRAEKVLLAKIFWGKSKEPPRAWPLITAYAAPILCQSRGGRSDGKAETCSALMGFGVVLAHPLGFLP